MESADRTCSALPYVQVDVHILQYQHRCMLRRVHQYKAVLDRFGLELQRTVITTVEPATIVPTEPLLEKTIAPRKKQAVGVGKWQYCEICAEQPKRKKEVLIRRCGHAMCKTCLNELRRVRDLHCPTCRIPFSVLGEIQLLVKCRVSDLQ